MFNINVDSLTTFQLFVFYGGLIGVCGAIAVPVIITLAYAVKETFEEFRRDIEKSLEETYTKLNSEKENDEDR